MRGPISTSPRSPIYVPLAVLYAIVLQILTSIRGTSPAWIEGRLHAAVTQHLRGEGPKDSNLWDQSGRISIKDAHEPLQGQLKAVEPWLGATLSGAGAWSTDYDRGASHFEERVQFQSPSAFAGERSTLKLTSLVLNQNRTYVQKLKELLSYSYVRIIYKMAISTLTRVYRISPSLILRLAKVRDLIEGS